MNLTTRFVLPLLIAATSLTSAQEHLHQPEPDKAAAAAPDHRVVITGARFSYALIESWIDQYRAVAPDVDVIIDPRSVTDPLQYDILAEVYEHDDGLKSKRAYLKVGRYAILPVVKTGSPLAEAFAETGLDAELIKQIFFHNVFSAPTKRGLNGIPFTVYTRLQKAGAPEVFSKYFGFEQKDLKGIAIAGADAHLLQALRADSTGVTYLPMPLIYDRHTRRPVDGVALLPIDINANRRISDDEKRYQDMDEVIARLEAERPANIRNIPIADLHLSVDKQRASKAAIDFINWVNAHGRRDLHKFGYLSPEATGSDDKSFQDFAAGEIDDEK